MTVDLLGEIARTWVACRGAIISLRAEQRLLFQGTAAGTRPRPTAAAGTHHRAHSLDPTPLQLSRIMEKRNHVYFHAVFTLVPSTSKL